MKQGEGVGVKVYLGAGWAAGAPSAAPLFLFML